MRLCSCLLEFPQYGLVLGREYCSPEQVRSPLERRPQGLPAPPLHDGRMVPRSERLRHADTIKIDRTRVLWPLEEAMKERVLLNGVAITEHVREQPPDDIEEHHGGELSPSEDIIANGQLGMRVRLHPCIHAAIASTDKEQTLTLGQDFSEVLREHGALGTKEDDVRGAKACLEILNAPHDGLWLHNHPGTPTVWGIVRNAVAVCRKISQVVEMDLE